MISLATSLIGIWLVTPCWGQDEQIEIPWFRFRLWSSLNADKIGYATDMSYNRNTWMNPGTNAVELISYESLAASSPVVFAALENFGYTEDQWDCYINHYADYMWEEMVAEEVVQYWVALGWTEASWNEEADPPESNDADWEELTADQMEAAFELCFTSEIWNGVSLDLWPSLPEEPAPTMEATATPTMVPTGKPTSTPTGRPTNVPTVTKTPAPTRAPVPATFAPTSIPTTAPTLFPTSSTDSPSGVPNTALPTQSPSTSIPTQSPSTSFPTQSPSTSAPTLGPSPFPVLVPMPSEAPTQAPVRTTLNPTITPTSSDLPPLPAIPVVDDIRYVLWSELNETFKNHSRTLMYDEDTWNTPGTASIEIYAYSDIRFLGIQGSYEAIFQMGFSEETWDCHINHYNGYGWADLGESEVRPFVRALGWTEESWDDEAFVPASNDASWVELSETERLGAQGLCYRRETWDGLDIASFGITEAPIGAPLVDATNAPVEPGVERGQLAYFPVNTRDIELPWFRYQLWTSLNASNIENAIGMSYDQAAWENPGSYKLETISYESIAADGTEIFTHLQAFGYTEDQWDCYIVHYADYSWEELEAEDVQQYWVALGWTNASWAEVAGPPRSDDLFWEQLSVEETAAAVDLCFFAELWNEVQLSRWPLLPHDPTVFKLPGEQPTSKPIQASTAPSKLCGGMTWLWMSAVAVTSVVLSAI